MITARLRDQQGGVAGVLRDSNIAPYYPPATVGAARVQVWVRSKGVGVDAAIMVGVYKPGADVEFGVDSVGARDLLVAAVPVSGTNTPGISDLNHAEWLELNYEPQTGTAAGLDEHVPDVTTPPVVTKSGSGDFWWVFTQLPPNSSTLTDINVRVRKADDLSPVAVWPFGPTASHLVEMTAFDAVIDWQARNQSPEDVGQGRGWSDWSPAAAAPGIGSIASGAAALPPPAGPTGVLTDGTFEADPDDNRAPIEKGVLAT
jgi:hypothetical protein